MANRYYCRVTNVTIPNGADIRSCSLRSKAFDAQVTSNIRTNCYFVNADNPAAPINKTQLDAFPLTAGVAWDNLPAWADGIEYQTPDLSAILQTVIDRSGWEAGNALILIIEDDSSPSGVHRKMSAFEYLGQSERPVLNVGWYSSWENFFDNTRWEPAQLDPLTNIETSWSGSVWNFNINTDSDGGRLVVKGTWHVNYQPKEIKVYHTHSGTPELKIYAADGIIYHSLGYTSGAVITPLWVGRDEGIYRMEFLLPAGDDTPFTVTNISFNSESAGVQTSTSTSSTASTTSSSSSTASTSSTQSTTSSTVSTSSTISTTSSTLSSTTTTASTASTVSTISTHTSFTTTSSSSTSSSTISTTSSSSSTASTISTESGSTSSHSSTSSTASSTSSSSSTVSTISTASGVTTSDSTTSSSSSTISTTSTMSSTSSSSSTASTTTTATSPPGQFSVKIVASGDDGQATTNTFNFNTSLDYVNLGNVAGQLYHTFFRFTSVNIPKDSVISSAIIRFNAYSNGSNNTVNLNIRIEDADDPSAPSSGTDLTGRSLGSAIAWDGEQSWTAGNSYDSDDFSSILETHLARDGWNANQALIVHIINDISSNNSNRVPKTYDESTTLCAELRVSYS